MILKGAQVLPHALINHVETKLGKNGEKLLEYVKWLHDRIIALRKDELEVDEIRLYDINEERQRKVGVLVDWICMRTSNSTSSSR